MRILSVRHIDGPNVFIYKPVMMARLDLEELAERESYEFPGFSDRLLSLFPGLREHHCAKGQPGGFVERLYGGTYFGHIVEHVAIELACCAGLDVHYGKTLYAGDLGCYDVIMECRAYECQRVLLERTVTVVQALLNAEQPDIETAIEEARQVLARTGLGPSTQALLDAAVKCDIPVRRLSEGSLLQLGYGRNRRLIQATLTQNTSAVGVDIATDKDLTKCLLRVAGIPVPDGATAETEEEAVELWRRMGPPLAVKPFNGNQGRGVSLNLATEMEVRRAHQIASQYSSRVIVERHVRGQHVRVLVIGGRYIAASERLPARVCGDGMRSIRELIDTVNRNPVRGLDHEKPLTRIPIDSVVMHTLQKQGLTLDSVPACRDIVSLRDSANLSTGGEAIDVTQDLHPTYRAIAERAARMVGLDVCGIDMVVTSILGSPQEQADCTVIEVNAAPGIRMHVHPSYGASRDVAKHILDSLYPKGTSSRIPIVSVTGTNGKTTTTRLIGHGIGLSGQTVGMTTTGGVFVGGRVVLEGDTTGPVSARGVLSDPDVDVAVLETARGGMLRGGLGYDKATIAVLTNITLDHVGQDGVETTEDLLRTKSLVAECVHADGSVVLNADDEHLVGLARRLKSKVIYFSMRDSNPVVKRHLACGGVAYYVSRGWLVEARGSMAWDIVQVNAIPLTLNGSAAFQIENCLAAVSALRAHGLTRQAVAKALLTFDPAVHNPGRCMLYRMPSGVRVVLDYGHNPDGFEKVGNWLSRVAASRLIGVVGVPGDRSNEVVREGADRLAAVFDAFVVKEDEDKRGRDPGEIAQLMAAQIRQQAPHKPCVIQLSEADAVEEALVQARSGDVVAVFFEKLSTVQAVVRMKGGKAVKAEEFTASETASLAVPL